jgi:hypothetical protein
VPFFSATRSKYSVSFAFSLYGTPFRVTYPGRNFVVTTFSEPPCGPPLPPPPKKSPPAPAFPRSQSALELPCQSAVCASGGLLK